MFILQRTNFVSTKNIVNCVLLFLYVLPIDDQAEVRRNADIQVPEGCHWPSHYIQCMMEANKNRSPDYYNFCRHILRTCLYIETKTWWACNFEKSKSNTFFNSNTSSCLYQCYCLSSHFTTHYYFIFPQKCKRVLYFLQLLG